MVYNTLVIVYLLLVASAVAYQYCNLADNVDFNGVRNISETDLWWNPNCTSNQSLPYCTQTETTTQCNECNPDRFGTYYMMCDCPANQFCDPDTESWSYGTCIDYYGGNASDCVIDQDCPIYVYADNHKGSRVFGDWHCVKGHCRPCNPGMYANYTVKCPGGSPYPLSSHAGETRWCNPDGFWESGNIEEEEEEEDDDDRFY